MTDERSRGCVCGCVKRCASSTTDLQLLQTGKMTKMLVFFDQYSGSALTSMPKSTNFYFPAVAHASTCCIPCSEEANRSGWQKGEANPNNLQLVLLWSSGPLSCHQDQQHQSRGCGWLYANHHHLNQILRGCQLRQHRQRERISKSLRKTRAQWAVMVNF